MGYLNQYVEHLKMLSRSSLADSVTKTANDIGENILKTFSFRSHEIGLLLGNVQSGKTAQVFGIISRAVDLGFSAFVLLTTDNVSLYQQTIDRVRFDLPQFCICGEPDDTIFVQNNLVQPVIVVLKKNSRVLKKWANVFGSTSFMRGNPLFVVDDEGDAASLNTKVNSKTNTKSQINKYLSSIKDGASSSIYLQVTGTPQALYLQTQLSGWHPLFTYYFKPGNGYLGGDFFFPEQQRPKCIQSIDELDNPERDAVLHHIAVSSLIAAQNGSASNFLVHPSHKQDKHDEFYNKVKNELKWCQEHIENEAKDCLMTIYQSITPQKCTKCDFNTYYKQAKDLLRLSSIRVFKMNGQNTLDSSAYEQGFNIIIGGNTLGRGVTFPALHTVYYTRSTKTPQADTMWQHSRMFGYDRDPGLVKVFMEERLYKLFSDINATNNAIINQIENGVQNVQIFYPDGLNPTRGVVIDNKHVTALSGGTNYFPREPGNTSIVELDHLLEHFDEHEASYSVSLKLFIEIFSYLTSDDDFRISSFVSCMNAILAQRPTAQGTLIVRRNRQISKGTGALLSPNDLEIGKQIKNCVVLTMYKVTGTNKDGQIQWGGKSIWIPNIKLPSDIIYYNVDDINEDD